MTIVEFLRAVYDDEEAAARAAIDEERPGTHWQWVPNDNDTVVKPGELAEAQEYQSVSLRTVEKYPTTSGVGDLPAFAIAHVEEVHPGAGDHIARHDPARVLAEVEAKRRIVEHCEPDALTLSAGDDYVLRLLALPHADRPGYDEEWRP